MNILLTLYVSRHFISLIVTQTTKCMIKLLFTFFTIKHLLAHTLLVSYLALHTSKLVVASAGDDQLWRLPEGELICRGQGTARALWG